MRILDHTCLLKRVIGIKIKNTNYVDYLVMIMFLKVTKI